MKSFKLTLPLAAFVLIASWGYAQKDSTATPIPTIYVGTNILGGKVNKDILLAAPLLRVEPPDLGWSIESYRVVFVRNGVERPPITVIGAEFTEQIKSLIRTAQSGTVMEISEIRIKSVNGSRRISMAPFLIRIN